VRWPKGLLCLGERAKVCFMRAAFELYLLPEKQGPLYELVNLATGELLTAYLRFECSNDLGKENRSRGTL